MKMCVQERLTFKDIWFINPLQKYFSLREEKMKTSRIKTSKTTLPKYEGHTLIEYDVHSILLTAALFLGTALLPGLSLTTAFAAVWRRFSDQSLFKNAKSNNFDVYIVHDCFIGWLHILGGERGREMSVPCLGGAIIQHRLFICMQPKKIEKKLLYIVSPILQCIILPFVTKLREKG